MSNILYIVVPCYNEQEVLPETSKRLREKVQTLRQSGKIDADSRILFVNDGSKDATWEMVQKLHEENPVFSGVNLSRNRGHQNALLAGIAVASEHADMIISMDADLQDDVDAMDRMIDAYEAGNDIVYGVRSSRQKDTFFKRNTAQLFYRLLHFLGAEVVYNHDPDLIDCYIYELNSVQMRYKFLLTSIRNYELRTQKNPEDFYTKNPLELSES